MTAPVYKVAIVKGSLKGAHGQQIDKALANISMDRIVYYAERFNYGYARDNLQQEIYKKQLELGLWKEENSREKAKRHVQDIGEQTASRFCIQIPDTDLHAVLVSA